MRNSLNLPSIAEKWLLAHSHLPFILVQEATHLVLYKTDESKQEPISVDFLSDIMTYRRQFGGGRREAIAKAVGMKGTASPTVIDATAGLGRDAFILASLGCHVTMFERHPVVAALLQDGLARAYRNANIGSWVSERLQLIYGSSHDELILQKSQPDVVYLDPMFPHRKKSALVKKEMRIFQALVGEDSDVDNLLTIARRIAKKRVVVKRPSRAPFLANLPPAGEVSTKNHRFDLYSPI